MFNLDEILLKALGSKELVDVWWSSPNVAFDLDTPQQVFNQQSTYQQVVNYICSTLNR